MTWQQFTDITFCSLIDCHSTLSLDTLSLCRSKWNGRYVMKKESYNYFHRYKAQSLSMLTTVFSILCLLWHTIHHTHDFDHQNTQGTLLCTTVNMARAKRSLFQPETDLCSTRVTTDTERQTRNPEVAFCSPGHSMFLFILLFILRFTCSIHA